LKKRVGHCYYTIYVEERSPAKYPIRRVVCKSFTIPQNYLDISHGILFSGLLPTRIVIGLVDNRAYNGDRQRNPFNFQHFNMNEIAFGRSATACRNTRSTRLWARTLYKSLQQHVCRKLCKDEGLYISREDYSAGYALCVFDLTADLGEENHYSLVRQEIVRLSLKFSAALANTVTAVAYAEFENVIEVDRDRNVVFDFGV